MRNLWVERWEIFFAQKFHIEFLKVNFCHPFEKKGARNKFTTILSLNNNGRNY